MPWQSNDDLPEMVRSALPVAAQSVFRATANAQLGSGASEESAMRTAWAAVKEHWRKDPSGNWVHKADSLYDRLGGIFAIADLVNDFSDSLLDDPVAGRDSKNPRLREWHAKNLDDRLPGLKWMRTLWVADVTGGPYRFKATRPGSTRLGLEAAHRHLELTSEEFDAVAAVLAKTLTAFKVPSSDKDLILDAFADHKREVLGETVKGTDQPVEKIGARNSRSDLTDIQAMHDATVRLGASCYHPDEQVEKRSQDEQVDKRSQRPLYVKRTLLNADTFIAWARSQGFMPTLQAGDLHVTVARSSVPLEWPAPVKTNLTADDREGREVVRLGDTATVLKFRSAELLNRWDYLRSIGSSWDFDAYMPHVTITNLENDVSLGDVAPYKGPLVFGPEQFEVPNDDWQNTVTEKKEIVVDVTKIDTELGIVFGWAIISKIEGEDYYDTQGDHIPEFSMLRAAARYMAGPRIAGNMHKYADGTASSVERVGTVLFAWPLTSDVSKSMKLKSKQTGLMIGMRVDTPAILAKFKSGEYTGFSIGGRRLKDVSVV